MGHNNPWQFSTLIRLLDDARNDLFVHIDKKSKSFPMDIFENLTQASRLVLLPRKECRWAEFSQVEVELDLLQEAAQTGTYDYYHLLSGHDLPLKTQDEIHAFFDAHEKEEFVGYFGGGKTYHDRYVNYRHPFLKCNQFRNSRLLKAADVAFTSLQEFLGLNVQLERNTKNWHFADGWQWFSITDEFTRFILSQRTYIQSIFKDAKAPDEFLVSTLLYNSPFFERLCSNRSAEVGRGSMRFIDWHRGTPYVFRKEDFEELVASPCLFARKFDEKIDRQIIERLYQHLKR